MQKYIEQLREGYAELGQPLLLAICKLRGIRIREFAAIFGISRSQAEKIVKERILPNMELGFRIARYFETPVDDLFGWRVDDTGERQPLTIELRSRKKIRLGKSYHYQGFPDMRIIPMVIRVHEESKTVEGFKRMNTALLRMKKP